MKEEPFLVDIRALRERARRHIEEGAVTERYEAPRETVVRLLNEALATEIVCALRYRRHYHAAAGFHGEIVRSLFLEHAKEEEDHAEMLAERIHQLGEDPDYSPEGLATRSYSEYAEGGSLVEMLKEDLIAERIAIESYSEIVRYVANDDPTTRRVLEEILAHEEEHAAELSNILSDIETH